MIYLSTGRNGRLPSRRPPSPPVFSSLLFRQRWFKIAEAGGGGAQLQEAMRVAPGEIDIAVQGFDGGGLGFRQGHRRDAGNGLVAEGEGGIRVGQLQTHGQAQQGGGLRGAEAIKAQGAGVGIRLQGGEEPALGDGFRGGASDREEDHHRDAGGGRGVGQGQGLGLRHVVRHGNAVKIGGPVHGGGQGLRRGLGIWMAGNQELFRGRIRAEVFIDAFHLVGIGVEAVGDELGGGLVRGMTRRSARKPSSVRSRRPVLKAEEVGVEADRDWAKHSAMAARTEGCCRAGCTTGRGGICMIGLPWVWTPRIKASWPSAEGRRPMSTWVSERVFREENSLFCSSVSSLMVRFMVWLKNIAM